LIIVTALQVPTRQASGPAESRTEPLGTPGNRSRNRFQRGKRPCQSSALGVTRSFEICTCGNEPWHRNALV
ncbi:MAG: hypothetical protein N3G20_05215, partial [Verrucomicrobiae bacterium]|nr:hypothetical protein [Verrucomicrobiae bacterium]